MGLLFPKVLVFDTNLQLKSHFKQPTFPIRTASRHSFWVAIEKWLNPLKWRRGGSETDNSCWGNCSRKYRKFSASSIIALKVLRFFFYKLVTRSIRENQIIQYDEFFSPTHIVRLASDFICHRLEQHPWRTLPFQLWPGEFKQLQVSTCNCH